MFVAHDGAKLGATYLFLDFTVIPKDRIQHFATVSKLKVLEEEVELSELASPVAWRGLRHVLGLAKIVLEISVWPMASSRH